MKQVQREIKIDPLAELRPRVFLDYFLNVHRDIIRGSKYLSHDGQDDKFNALLVRVVLKQVDAGLQTSLQGRDENSFDVHLVNVLLHGLRLEHAQSMQVRVEVGRV